MRAKVPYQKKGKRLGRGVGSGRGKTSGRGHKGQGARSGATKNPGFEGGQNPLYRRLPKRGFNNAAFSVECEIANVKQISDLGLKEVTPEILAKKGVIKRKNCEIKILGDGELKQAVTVKAHRFSASAKEKIEKAGGQVILIES